MLTARPIQEILEIRSSENCRRIEKLERHGQPELLRNVRLKQVLLLLVGLIFVVCSSLAAEDVSRIDLPKIAKKVQSQGMADYIPVAYRTTPVATGDWTPLDPTARAHFLLYMSQDCSHFVLKWELPALVLIGQQHKESASWKESGGIQSRPGPGPKVLKFRDEKRNLVLNSYPVGRMPRLFTRGPFNAMADAAHNRSAWAPEKWGAIIHCSLHLGDDEAGVTAPIALYETYADENGDMLSGAAVMEVPGAVVETIRRSIKQTTPLNTAAPLYWCVTANMYNIGFLEQRTEIREVKAMWETVGKIVKIADMISGIKTEEDAIETGIEFILDAMLGDSIPSIPGPGEVLFMFQKAVFFAVLDKVDRELARLTNVRVIYMYRPEPFSASPWTFTYLDGPVKGTDTWDAVELRGGYVDIGKYTWICGAGAFREWAARLTVRPSSIVVPRIETPLPFDELIVGAQQMHFQIQRTDKNWELIDRCLIENYRDHVNSPMLMFVSHPFVNYEILDQEINQGTDADKPSVTRKQTFGSLSICTGGEAIYGRNRKVDFEAAHRDAVTVRGTGFEVAVTFNRGAVPQGEVLVKPYEVEFVRGPVLESMGLEVKQFNPAQYDEAWWYDLLNRQGDDREKLLGQLRQYREETGTGQPISAFAKKERVQEQIGYLADHKKQLSNRRETQAEQQRKSWMEALGGCFAIREGTLQFNPQGSRLSGNVKFKNLNINYVPSFDPLSIKEPINWYGLVVAENSRVLPDLSAAKPQIIIEEDRIVIKYKGRGGKEKMAILNKHPKTKSPQGNR